MLANVQLGLGDYAVIGGMLVIANGILVTYIRSVAGRVDRVEAKVDDVEQRAQAQLGRLQDKKTDKHEWAREMLTSRAKLEDLSKQITGLSGKVEANIAFGSAITRLADELVKLRETPGPRQPANPAGVTDHG